MSCFCAVMTARGLPPPAGWDCPICGSVGVGPGPAKPHRDIEAEFIDRVERAFDYANAKWRQGDTGGRAQYPSFQFTRDFVIFRLKNPDSL